MQLANISEKMKALLAIAGKVQIMGKAVTQKDVDTAKASGASDRELHDTVLISATFSMFNRYVDGLATLTPQEPEAYEDMGKRMVEKGYVVPQPTIVS
jgi:alkylhydroperoxidase family enzyme